LGELGLKPREGLRYSLEEMAPKLESLDAKAFVAFHRKQEKKPIDLFEAKLLELSEHIQVFFNIANGTTPLLVPPQSSGDEWKSLATVRNEARRASLVAALKPTLEALVAPERFAKVTPEQRGELLIQLGGFVTPPKDAAVVEKRVLELLREK